MKITKMLGIAAAVSIVSSSAFAIKDLTDTRKVGVIDSQKVCVRTLGGLRGCGAAACDLKLNFASNSASLLSYDHACLHKRSAAVKGASSVSVVGHTDSVGNDAFNKRLSNRRAATVAKILRRHGVSNINVSGKGESSPIASNETEAGKAQNRRVEIN